MVLRLYPKRLAAFSAILLQLSGHFTATRLIKFDEGSSKTSMQTQTGRRHLGYKSVHLCCSFCFVVGKYGLTSSLSKPLSGSHPGFSFDLHLLRNSRLSRGPGSRGWLPTEAAFRKQNFSILGGCCALQGCLADIPALPQASRRGQGS